MWLRMCRCVQLLFPGEVRRIKQTKQTKQLHECVLVSGVSFRVCLSGVQFAFTGRWSRCGMRYLIVIRVILLLFC